MIERVKLRDEDGVQTLAIPRGMALDASEVFVRREGDKLTVEPAMVTDKASFFAWLRTIEPWDGPGPDLADPPPEDSKL